MDKEKEIKFEDALLRLEEIVEELEKGELSLDETLRIFEEGIRMSKICSKQFLLYTCLRECILIWSMLADTVSICPLILLVGCLSHC